MEMDQELKRYSFHATWELERNLTKPFEILMLHISHHIEGETRKTFAEEGLLFKSYLYGSGLGVNSNKNKQQATACLNEVIDRLKKWYPDTSPEKDGFLSVAYALEAWIDIDKSEPRLQDLKKLYFNNRNETRKRFEAAIHYIKGFSLSRLGVNRYAEYIDEFRQAKEKCPENHEYLFAFAHLSRKCNGNDAGKKEVRNMLLEVLKKEKDYLYAKVDLAYLADSDGNTTEATELLKQIITTLKAKHSSEITPEDMRILGHVMNIYLQMGKYDEGEDAYNIADGCRHRLHSSVLEHRATLAKKKEQWEDYTRFLKAALDNYPFNLKVKLKLARNRLHNAEIENVISEYDKILNDHNGYRIAEVQIWSDFGTNLWKKGDEKKAVLRYEESINKAIESCQLNPDKKSERIKFYGEVNFAVTMCVKNLRNYWKKDILNPQVCFKLAKLEYKLRNFYLSRSYCKDALAMQLNEKQKSDIACILADIEIDLSTDGEFASIDKTLDKVTPSDPKLEELRAKLDYKNGILLERRHHTDTLTKYYYSAAKSGHVGAIQRLFSALEILDKSSSAFYETCALIDTSIGVVPEQDRMSMREMLKKVLETAISGDLKRLRKQQFEMEKAHLNQSECYPDLVIHTSRKLLNYAMHRLTQRYSQKPDAKKTIDFFCIHKSFNKTETKVKVREKLEEYKWENTDELLIDFLVDIQPCTNPPVNNWIMAFMELDNKGKHKEQNRPSEKHKVYPQDEGARRAVYQDKEYNSVELARTVCDNIACILDNLNGFSLVF